MIYLQTLEQQFWFFNNDGLRHTCKEHQMINKCTNHSTRISRTLTHII